MGAIFSTIYQISPDDKRNLYVFTYGVQKWDDIYKWIEEKFVKISTSLGVEGLFVLSEDQPLDLELRNSYGQINEVINSIGVGKRGLVVSNLNPHRISVPQYIIQPEVLFIPIESTDRDELTRIIDKIIRAAKYNDISLLEPLSIPLDPLNKESFWNVINSNLFFKPSIAGIGVDIGNIGRQLIKRYGK